MSGCTALPPPRPSVSVGPPHHAVDGRLELVGFASYEVMRWVYDRYSSCERKVESELFISYVIAMLHAFHHKQTVSTSRMVAWGFVVHGLSSCSSPEEPGVVTVSTETRGVVL